MIEFLLTTAGCLLGFSHIATTPRTEIKMNETGETKMETVFNIMRKPLKISVDKSIHNRSALDNTRY